MAVLIEQQDDFWSGSSFALSTALPGRRGSGWAMIEGRVVSNLATGYALLAKQIL